MKHYISSCVLLFSMLFVSTEVMALQVLQEETGCWKKIHAEGSPITVKDQDEWWNTPWTTGGQGSGEINLDKWIINGWASAHDVDWGGEININLFKGNWYKEVWTHHAKCWGTSTAEVIRAHLTVWGHVELIKGDSSGSGQGGWTFDSNITEEITAELPPMAGSTTKEKVAGVEANYRGLGLSVPIYTIHKQRTKIPRDDQNGTDSNGPKVTDRFSYNLKSFIALEAWANESIKHWIVGPIRAVLFLKKAQAAVHVNGIATIETELLCDNPLSEAFRDPFLRLFHSSSNPESGQHNGSSGPNDTSKLSAEEPIFLVSKFDSPVVWTTSKPNTHVPTNGSTSTGTMSKPNRYVPTNGSSSNGTTYKPNRSVPTNGSTSTGTMPKLNTYDSTNGSYSQARGKVLFPHEEGDKDKMTLYSARKKVEHQLKEKFPPFLKKHGGLQKAFDKFDTDPKDGLISLSEMEKVLEDLGFESFRVGFVFTVEIEDVAPGAIQFIEEEAREKNNEIPGKPDGKVSLEELAAADLE